MFSIAQNLLNVTKKLVFLDINLKLENIISDFLDNLLFCFDENKYIKTVLNFEKAIYELLNHFFKYIVETLDNQFKLSSERLKSWNINKSNVTRTIVTIFGTIFFSRTYYESKNKKEKLFYVDKVLGLESYKRYDPIVRGYVIDKTIKTNANKISLYATDVNTPILNQINNSEENRIPRQTIYRWIKEWHLTKPKYDTITVPNKKLFVMADEKWIHEQIHEEQSEEEKKKHHFIMSKCFVVFTGIKQKGKRKELVGKHIFITSSKNPWIEFINEVSQIYDFETIEEINFLSDGGNWLLAGTNELKLFPSNIVIVNTCEFHVKQKINRSTTSKELREKLYNLVYEDNKKEFILEMDKLMEGKSEKRIATITQYKNYIINHWKTILNMQNCECKSSMESHISHYLAEQFGSRPKGYSKNTISKYLKLHEYYLNGINIYDLYLKTYNEEEYVYNEKELNFSLFEKSNSKLPTIYNRVKNFKFLP